MAQLRLVLVDTDHLFLERLSDYIQRNKSERFTMELFTQIPVFESWVSSGGKADLMVMSARVLSQVTLKLGNQPIAVLNDGFPVQYPEGIAIIKKYQPADALIKELLSLCADSLRTETEVKEGTGRIHLILYVDGSDLCHPLAPNIAFCLAQRGKKVFYLSLDHIPVTDCYFSGTNEKGLSEMLYFLKSRKEGLSLKAESCTTKDASTGVEFMKAQKNLDDLADLSSQDIKALLEALKSRGCYDEIVVSREFRSDEPLIECLRQSGTISLAASDRPVAVRRLNRILEYLSLLNDKHSLGLIDKCTIAMAQDDMGTPPSITDTMGLRKAFFPSQNNQRFPQEGQYASSIKSLLML
ncbi:MAG: hypothetical protein N2376_13170 [Clostridia bacterium]|nr:hypothetical protein [Clostridia bacterium]